MSYEIALTGINAASTELDVIANNIANSGTTGFKRSNVEFADVFASGAMNISGRGVKVTDVRQNFSQGDLTTSDNSLDLGVEGQGMFQLSDNGSPVYTRAGAFGLDEEGYVVSSDDLRLRGYSADADGRIEPTLGDIQVEFKDIQPKVTSTVELNMNLDSDAEVLPPFDVTDPDTYNFSTQTTVYDSLGAGQTATTYLHKDAPNTWTSYLFVDDQPINAAGDELVFTAEGQLDTVNGAAGTTTQSGPFTPVSGGSDMDLTYDISNITQYQSKFGVNQIAQDGYTTGRLDDVEFNTEGVLFGRFSNGQTKEMGQVVLANFTNKNGLSAAGGTNWSETPDSGPATIGTPGSASLGLIQSGSLEQSNVNLTEELVSMISAQRGFQANAQVISTADEVTQTVINLKR